MRVWDISTKKALILRSRAAASRRMAAKRLLNEFWAYATTLPCKGRAIAYV
jgi:hypothetical protein